MTKLTPHDHAERVALFRQQIIGSVSCRELAHGELRAELIDLSKKLFRFPGSAVTRTYSVPTLERWYYAHREHGLEGLKPKGRSDRGRARELSEEQRELLLNIRREHRSVSAAVILRTLVADGRIDKNKVSLVTVRRLFREHRLERLAHETDTSKIRLRWQAARPGALWHGDVCHGSPIVVSGARLPVRIHALLDDASRYVVALEAQHSEREVDMLAIFVDALRRVGAPDALYLDNGSTYSGDILRIACARLGITLLHARPYDPEARGKMERFWRTLREGCLDHLGAVASLHDINVRMFAFLDQHYHVAPHAGLMGRAPKNVWDEGLSTHSHDQLSEAKLREALMVHERRRVRGDSTVSVGGTDFQVDAAFLGGRVVTIAYCPLDVPIAPTLEHDGRIYPLHPVDPLRNAKRGRVIAEKQPAAKTTDFDPAGALLDRALGRTKKGRKK